MMDKSIKQKWIEALRSGEYEQIKASLHAEGKFCCLGVLCDLHAKEVEEAEWSEGHIGGDRGMYGKTVFLPEEVVEWARLEKHVLAKNKGDVKVTGGTLSEFNDKGYTFEEIAKTIELEL